ncbi:MAG: methionyl-tRNA formyltransferase, partial [Candidatus Latescibacteria bacterium]|nr:methionyl-tRNA formyltransferase [Candidatus Latescibacterota bacterium]
MRLVVMGTPEFAVPTLISLAEQSHEIVRVVTQPDRPKGRGRKLQASDIKIAAQELGLTVLQPPSVTDPEFAEELKSLKPDLFVVVAFSILPAPLLTIPDRGAINLHASLLPQYRGAAPIHWAVSDGQTKTGLTVFSLKPSVDSGDILCQVPISIGPDETTGELYDRMKSVGAEAVVQVVDEIE